MKVSTIQYIRIYLHNRFRLDILDVVALYLPTQRKDGAVLGGNSV